MEPTSLLCSFFTLQEFSPLRFGEGGAERGGEGLHIVPPLLEARGDVLRDILERGRLDSLARTSEDRAVPDPVHLVKPGAVSLKSRNVLVYFCAAFVCDK